MRRMATMVAVALLATGTVAAIAAAATPTDDMTPSTNEQNKLNGWAHFDVLDVRPGEEGGFEVDIEYVQPRRISSCFEWRIDGEGPQQGDHSTDGVEDGLWSFRCLNRAETTWSATYLVNETLEIRLVCCEFSGGLRTGDPAEFFTWTPVSLTDDTEANPGDPGDPGEPGEPAGDPGEEVTSPHIDGYCKNGAWTGNWFRNQGQCIASVQANENAGKAGSPGDPAGDPGDPAGDPGDPAGAGDPAGDAGDPAGDPGEAVTSSDTDEYCKNGAWEGNGFRNQGQCLASVQPNGTAGK